jgi:serine protease Do
LAASFGKEFAVRPRFSRFSLPRFQPARWLVLVSIAGLAACSSGTTAVSAAGQSALGAAHFARSASPPDFRSVTQDGLRAVVSVQVTGSRELSDAGGSGDDAADQQLLELLRKRFGSVPAIRVPVRGQGSGFIISPDGVILTNAHVVRDADSVTVRFTDRQEFPARVLGADPVTDIAVLKIDGSKLPTVRLGDASRLRPGEWVLAIGSPFGLENSVTAGMVSALQRPLPDEAAVRFIQTDVPINPGNSGGPLFNTRGEVVGINSQIYSLSGGYQGVSFAIPIDVAQQVGRQILATGRAEHAGLGVTAQDMDASLASAFRLARPDGALLAMVKEDGAGAHAGLRTGDVVLAVDGRPVTLSSDLSTNVAMRRPGDRVSLAVWRDGARRDVPVTLGEVGSEKAPAAQEAIAKPDADAVGLVLRPLRPQDGAAVTQGLVVEGVSGRAAQAGLQPGDIVLRVDGKPADTPSVVRDALGAGPVALLVRRGQDQQYVALPPARPNHKTRFDAPADPTRPGP